MSVIERDRKRDRKRDREGHSLGIKKHFRTKSDITLESDDAKVAHINVHSSNVHDIE